MCISFSSLEGQGNRSLDRAWDSPKATARWQRRLNSKDSNLVAGPLAFSIHSTNNCVVNLGANGFLGSNVPRARAVHRGDRTSSEDDAGQQDSWVTTGQRCGCRDGELYPSFQSHPVVQFYNSLSELLISQRPTQAPGTRVFSQAASTPLCSPLLPFSSVCLQSQGIGMERAPYSS